MWLVRLVCLITVGGHLRDQAHGSDVSLTESLALLDVTTAATTHDNPKPTMASSNETGDIYPIVIEDKSLDVCNETEKHSCPDVHVPVNRGMIISSNDGLVSTQSLRSLRAVLHLCALPVVLVLGTVFNIINVIVFTRSSMRNSFNTYLLALSFADLVYLGVKFIMWSFDMIDHFNKPLYQVTVMSFNYLALKDYVHIATGRLSNWLVLVLSLERFIAVKWPLKAKLSPLHRHPWKVIIAITVFVYLILVVQLFSSKMVLIVNPVTNATRLVYQRSEFITMNYAFYRVYAYIILFLFRFVPIFFVVLFNMGIIVSLALNRKSSIRSTKKNEKGSDKDSKMTRMLIAISALFLVCVGPNLTHTSVGMVIPKDYSVIGKNRNAFKVVSIVFDLLDAINSAVNFFIYIILGKNFRSVFKNTVTGRPFVKESKTPTSQQGTKSTQASS